MSVKNSKHIIITKEQGTNAKTAGSAASNMSFSTGSADVKAETTSVRHSWTFSVIPSDSIYAARRAGIQLTNGDVYV